MQAISASLGCFRRLGYFRRAGRDRNGGGFTFALDLHGPEFDAILIERLLDHCAGLAPDRELLASSTC
jgi:hypothetical protein